MTNQTENKFWKERKVLVTGATGIVGSWLVKELCNAGAQVIAFVRDSDPQSEFFRSNDYKRVNVVNGMLEDFWAVERAINDHEINTVFHLAAQPIVGVAHRMPLQTFEANIRGTYHVMEACRLHHRKVERVVVASSDKAYGTHENLPYTEDMSLQGKAPYEVSKSCADLIAQSYFHTYGVSVGIARCGNIYGGGDLNWSRIIPGTIRSFMQRESPVIRSDGKYVRDYLYVKDVVTGYMMMAEQMDRKEVKGQAFNFSPEKAVTVLEIVKKLQTAMGAEKINPIIQNNAEGEIHSQYLNSARAKKVLGWAPKFTLDEGLAETISWYRNYFGIPAKSVPLITTRQVNLD